MLIHNEEVKGTNVEAQTRCAHYKSELDVIAIKFRCCGDWFPCFECHAENTNHSPEVWKADEFDAKVILCGNCGYQLTISEYFECQSVCPRCRAAFNPKCANHYHLYFEK